MKQFNIKMEQVQNLLTDKQLTLGQYKDDMEELQNQLEELKHDFEQKSKEVMQIKQEAVIQIK